MDNHLETCEVNLGAKDFGSVDTCEWFVTNARETVTSKYGNEYLQCPL